MAILSMAEISGEVVRSSITVHRVLGPGLLESAYQKCLEVEVKSVARWDPIFDAQLLTYLRLTNLTVGLLLNFNVPVMRNGIKRLVWHYQGDSASPAPLR